MTAWSLADAHAEIDRLTAMLVEMTDIAQPVLSGEFKRQAARIAVLEGVISWVEPPFVDENTSDAELRQRIGFMHADILRAAALAPPVEKEDEVHQQAQPSGTAGDSSGG